VKLAVNMTYPDASGGRDENGYQRVTRRPETNRTNYGRQNDYSNTGGNGGVGNEGNGCNVGNGGNVGNGAIIKDYEVIYKCISTSSSSIEYLLRKGFDIHYDNDYIFRKAVDNNSYSIIQYLIKYGANVSVNNEYALKKYVNLNQSKIVKQLIQYGANVYVDNNYLLDYTEKEKMYKMKNILMYTTKKY